MSYYLFNRQEILQKAKKTYSKEKARNRYNNLSEEEKTKIKEYQKKEVSRIDSI